LRLLFKKNNREVKPEGKQRPVLEMPSHLAMARLVFETILKMLVYLLRKKKRKKQES